MTDSPISVVYRHLYNNISYAMDTYCGFKKSSYVVPAREFKAADNVDSPAANMPAINNPGKPGISRPISNT